MPKLEFTPDELKQYFNDRRNHYYRSDSVKMEREMRVHFDGIYPKELIDERRPNESEEVMDYRKKIFIPKTKPYTTKIESTLQKIRRSSDWSIKYPNGSFDRVVDGEKMFDYAEKKYPTFDSVTNWAFSVLLRNYLIDANAVAVVAPVELPELENEYTRPVVTIFNSEDVIDFVEDDYAVLRNKKGAMYGRNVKGESYYVITTEYIHRYDQINSRKEFAVMFEYNHQLGELPAFQLGGVVVDNYGLHTLYESRIAGILPEFNEALREYSDLQAAKVLHLYPERWEYTQNECTNCKGTGKRTEVVNNETCQVTCNTCAGAGYVASGPYSKILVKPAAADALQVPTPPAGFVEKDVEIIKVQEQSINDHIVQGLASINFEFLAATPLNQSGTAKEVDKDELNTTVHAVAEDLVRIIDKVYYLTARYRYSVQYTTEQIIEMLPMVAVPEKYDILSTKYFDEQITSAKNNKLSPAIITAMEVAYATKAFNNDLEIAEHVNLVLSLDPLGGISEDDKMSRLSNNGITKLDYVVSSNINKFVNEAMIENANFKDLPINRQREIIYAKGQAQMDAATQSLIPPMPDEEDS
jgi:hypothetical protein